MQSPLRPRDLFFLLGLCFVCYFWRLGAVGLHDFNEGLYVQAAREMYLRGDYVTPRINGLFFFDKPPLAIWLTALSFHVFGVNEFSARFPVAVAAALLVLLTAWFGARCFGRRAGLSAGAMVALSPMMLGTARQMTMDVHQSLWFGVAMVCFFLGFTASTPRGKRWYYGFWPACGLGFLAKSVPGLFPLFLCFLFITFHERFQVRPILRRVREAKLVPGLLLLIAVILPWHLLAYRENGYVFYDQYWLLHHVALLRGTDFSHVQPFWYYIPALLVGFFPWSVFLPFAAWRALKEWRSSVRGGDRETRSRGDKETGRQGDKETRRQGDRETGRQGEGETRTRTEPAGGEDSTLNPPPSLRFAESPSTLSTHDSRLTTHDSPNARLFVLVWAAGLFLLFSLMSSKLISYLLPMYAAAALLVGDWFAHRIESKAEGAERALKFGMTAVAACALLFCIAAQVVIRIAPNSPRLAADLAREFPPPMLNWALHTLLITALGCGIAAALQWKGKRAAGIRALVGTMTLFVGLAVTEGQDALQETKIGPLHRMARAAAVRVSEGMPLAIHIARPRYPSILFYLPDSAFVGKPLPTDPNADGLILERGEQEPILQFLALHPQAYVLTDHKRAEALRAVTPGLVLERETRQWALLRADRSQAAR